MADLVNPIVCVLFLGDNHSLTMLKTGKNVPVKTCRAFVSLMAGFLAFGKSGKDDHVFWQMTTMGANLSMPKGSATFRTNGRAT